MQSEKKDINWIEIMEKFSTHKGKIVDFCRENNIRPQQLYRQRKKLVASESSKACPH
jgi:predicted adenine nucleotide alpha hydrolase (AANH) superfamily ATPase